MKYEFSLRQQINQRGYYANVVFEISQNPSSESKITFEFQADEVWRIPCLAGLQIFSEYYYKPGSVHIKIVSVDWNPVDSNSLIVLYVVVQGLCQFFKLPIENLDFNSEKMVFSFPEPRNKRFLK